MALDSKMVIDDSSLVRQQIVQRFEAGTPLEARARSAGLNYVQLDGNIAVLGSGAGLAMATMDFISHYGAAPACFLDTGGGIVPKKWRRPCASAWQRRGLKRFWSTLSAASITANGWAEESPTLSTETSPPKKILVKMRGHSQDEGWKLLEDRHIPVVKFGTTEEAVDANRGARGKGRTRGKGRIKMAILINRETKVSVQGITGKMGGLHTRYMLDYGVNLMAGVSPGKGGSRVDTVPVYNTVPEALEHTPIDAAMVLVPPYAVRESATEAIESGIELVVIISEFVPIHDTAYVKQLAIEHGPESWGQIPSA